MSSSLLNKEEEKSGLYRRAVGATYPNRKQDEAHPQAGDSSCRDGCSILMLKKSRAQTNEINR